jgi:hypothetical protein
MSQLKRKQNPAKIFESEWDLAEWLVDLTANTYIATGRDLIPASSDTVKSEWRQME